MVACRYGIILLCTLTLGSLVLVLFLRRHGSNGQNLSTCDGNCNTNVF